MYPEAGQKAAIIVVAVVICGLAAHSAWEFWDRYSRPNPFVQPKVGVPALREGPFDPTRGGIRAEQLPWEIDPASTWPAPLRSRAAKGGDHLRAAALERYPLWEDHIRTAELTAQGALVLERHPHFELVVGSSGLRVQRRTP